MQHESVIKDVMGALYGVADKVTWLRDSVATKRGLQSVWADTKEIKTEIANNQKELKIELGGITQSISFIKDNSVTKEEFQSLRRELFEDIAFMKKILSNELAKKVDEIMSLYKHQEAAMESLLVRQDCFEDNFEEGFDDMSF